MEKTNLETVVFQVTTKCPYQCPQCYMERGEIQLPLEFAQAVADYAHSNGAQAIQITGGEPMTYGNLPELIGYVSAKGMYSFLATSGYKASHAFYELLKRQGLTVLCVSVNSVRREDNARTRMAYEEGIFAIKTAVASGLCCFANVVVTDENIGQLDFLGDYLVQLGVQCIHLLRPVPSFDGKYVPTVSLSTIKMLSSIVKRRPDLFFVERCFGEYWMYEQDGEYVCEDVGKSTFFVNADSSFSPCPKKNHIRFSNLEELERYKDYPTVRCFFCAKGK